MERNFRVAGYVGVIERYGAEEPAFAERMLIRDLPRRFHQLTSELQVRALAEPPRPIEDPRWKAYLAAVAEHIAILHGYDPPEWSQQDDCFLDIPWVPADNRVVRAESLLNAPAAFARHGVFPDPSELDRRGGEKHVWLER